ncbi:MAG: glycosyltransferase [Paludibacter sp.]|nr:glycosyltransferase [Paludibacter sp.]
MINVSIVLYNHSLSEICPLIECLRKSTIVSQVFLIDNSPIENPDFKTFGANYHFTGKNLGYGAAHNIAVRQTIEQEIPYHLVINPDISFDPKILSEIEEFMNNNSDIGLLMPKILYPNGEIQYLCKLIPTPFDLIVRRFLPKSWTQKRIEKFELRSSGYNKVMNVPYLSGCFMFLRTEALKQAGLFDERFFMYPEDIDLTRRIHKHYRTVFYPYATIIHHHAKSSYIDSRMLFIHIYNMIKYFNKWGWIFDKERTKVNRIILMQLKQS